MNAYTAAQTHKQNREDKWRKYHRIYRAYVDRGETPDWRSNLSIPYTFSIVEAIVPKMVAQLPSFVCQPMGPEDVISAQNMEGELDRAAEVTNLYVELIRAIKSSLKFGTGILKNYYDQDIRKAWEQVPAMETVTEMVAEPVADEEGIPSLDMDGNAQMTETPVESQQPVLDEMGQPVMQWVPYEYVAYEGPASVWIDPFNFYIAPEATSLDDARYVIHKITDKSQGYIQEQIVKGVYRLPPGIEEVSEMYSEWDGGSIRRDEEGETPRPTDTTRKPTELLEFWLDDGRVITVLNQTAIIRCQENPFFHGEYPFCDFPDYIQEGEFWGVGEVEAVEGLQDLENALVNQRIDNVRMVMDAMFAYNEKAIDDPRSLVMRPGGMIPIAGDYLPTEAIQRIDFGDVTGSAFAEAEQTEMLMQRVSGVTDFQMGLDSDTMSSTATGISIITEAGNTKFALKVRLMELVGLKRLARQWGSLIQQFTDQAKLVRTQGPTGAWMFANLTPDSIQGSLDFTIETQSTVQTESMRREEAMSLLQTAGAVYPVAVPKLFQDVLEAFGKKNLIPYMMGGMDPKLMVQMQQTQEGGGMILPFPQGGAAGGQPGAQGGGEEQPASDEGGY